MNRCTFYLIITAVVLMLYIFVTKEKLFKSPLTESFDETDDTTTTTIVPHQDPPAQSKLADPDPQKPLPDTKPQLVIAGEDIFKTYNANVISLNENIKQLLLQKDDPKAKHYAWY